MNKRYLILSLLIGVTALVSAQEEPKLASVKFRYREDIYLSDFQQQVSLLQQGRNVALSDKEKGDLLDLIIADILISQGAEAQGITVTEEEVLREIRKQAPPEMDDSALKKAVSEQANLSWDEYFKLASKTLVQRKYLESKKGAQYLKVPEPTEDQIRLFYEANATEFVNPEMVRVSHIFWDTRGKDQATRSALFEEAQGVQKELERGQADFFDMVQKHSQDPPSARRGGDLGYLPRNDIQSQRLFGTLFFQKLFDLKVGSISPVLESNVGYHIVRVNEHLSRRFLRLNDPISPVENISVRQYIRMQMMNQQGQRQLQQAIAELVEELKNDPRTEITIYEENL